MPERNGDLLDSEKRLVIFYLFNGNCECGSSRFTCMRCDLLNKTLKAWPALYEEVREIIRKKREAIAP
jgi:hypothetical protein